MPHSFIIGSRAEQQGVGLAREPEPGNETAMGAEGERDLDRLPGARGGSSPHNQKDAAIAAIVRAVPTEDSAVRV